MNSSNVENISPEFELANKVLTEIKPGDSRRAILQRAALAIASKIASQNVAIFEVDPWDPDQIMLAAAANKNDTANRRLLLPTVSSPGSGITAWCASQTRPGAMTHSQIQGETKFHSVLKPDHLGGHDLYSILWVPLRDSTSNLLGLLKCENKLDNKGNPGPIEIFEPSDIRLATSIQSALVTALQWPDKMSDVRLQARTIVRQISLKQLKGSLDPHQLFQTIISAAVRILGAQRGDLAWWTGEKHDLIYAEIEGGARSNHEIMVGAVMHRNSFMRAVFNNTKSDYDLDNQVHRRKKNYLKADDRTRSELAVRIDLHGNSVGVINVESFKENYFTMDEHLDALRDIAQAAAIAVQQTQSARLLQRALDHPGEPETILQPILEGVLESLGYDAGLILRHEPGGNCLCVAAHVPAPDIKIVPAEFRQKLDKPSFSKTVFELPPNESWYLCREPVGDLAVDQKALKDWNITGPLFGFPLEFEGRRVGCILLWSINRPPPRHINAVDSIRVFQRLAAAKIALWNKNAELLEKNTFFDVLSASFMMFTKRVEEWGKDERLPHAACTNQPKIVFEWANDQFKNHVGPEILKSIGTLEGHTDWEVFPEDAKEYYLDDIKTLEGTSVIGKPERNVRPRDRAVLQVRVWKSHFVGADKKRRILVFFWDRTARMRIEEESKLWSDDFYHRVTSCFRQINQLLLTKTADGQADLQTGILQKLHLKLRQSDDLIRLLYGKKRDVIDMNSFLTEAVQAVANIYAPAIPKQSISLHMNFCDVQFPSPKAYACVRIIAELVSNSYLWAFPDTRQIPDLRISCTLDLADGNYVLCVKDTGVPFEPRLEDVDSLKGIGIVKRLAVDSLGGSILHNPNSGSGKPSGNVWWIKFPVDPQQSPPRVHVDEGEGPRILLVEDDQEDAELFARALRDEKYCVVGPVRTREMALAVLEKEEISLVILDISLDDGLTAGIEVAKTIRSALKPGSDIPVIFLTKHETGEIYIEQAKRIAGSSILVKHGDRVTDDLVLTVFCRLRDRAQGDKLFICYPRKQEHYMKMLCGQLEAQGISDVLQVSVWSDEEIKPGSIWRDEIRKALDASIAAVLLVDNDFMISPFIQDSELPALLNSARIKGKGIFPVCVGATGTVLRGGGDLRNLQFMCGTLKDPIETLSEPAQTTKLFEIAKSIREDMTWILGRKSTPSIVPTSKIAPEGKLQSFRFRKSMSKTQPQGKKPFKRHHKR